MKLRSHSLHKRMVQGENRNSLFWVKGSCSVVDAVITIRLQWSDDGRYLEGVSSCSKDGAANPNSRVIGGFLVAVIVWLFAQMNSIHLLIRDSKKYLWKIHFHSSSPERPGLHLFLKPIRWQRTLQPLAYITCGAGVSSRMCRHHYVPVPYMLFNGLRGRPITHVATVAGILCSVDAKHRSRTFTSWTIFLKVNVGKDCVTSQKCWSRSYQEHLLRPSKIPPGSAPKVGPICTNGQMIFWKTVLCTNYGKFILLKWHNTLSGVFLLFTWGTI